MGIITHHLTHDGNPAGVETLAADAGLAPLAEVLRSMLRHDPNDRAEILDVKRSLGQLRKSYEGATWPLGGASN